jgi:uncharacterized sulfatase
MPPGIALLLSLSVAMQPAGERPNILWLSCEDISPHLGCYGDAHARTPNIDRFAARGVVYSHACVVAPVCAPCRSSIITGMYPTTIGTHLMRCRARLPEFVEPFPTLLRRSGYYCTNNSKTDYQFDPPAETWDASSGRAHWRGRRGPEQPFFAVFNYTGTHESQIFDAAAHRATTAGFAPCDRDAVASTLPPYYPDAPTTREDWGRYYDNIAALDRWFGRMLEQLEEDGLAEDTIVFFWSDHGAGLPRAKRWLYDSGMRVPLIVYVPEKWRGRAGVAEGGVDDRLVCLMDLGPTVLNLAGVAVPEHMQGRAFLGPNAPPPRTLLFAARDRMDERYDVIRAVRDRRYKYIVNFQSWKPYYQHVSYGEQCGVMKEIRRMAAEGILPAAAATFTADSKPFEELYDLQNDPHEIHNLVGEASLREVLRDMRAAQRRWMLETLDLGLIPESEIARREERLGSRYAILRQPDVGDLPERLLAAAESVSAGRAPTAIRIALLKDADPAVRWWGATGLKQVQGGLDKAIQDESPAVRIAAAAEWRRLEDVDAAMRVLIESLGDASPWVRLEAALALDQLGDAARPAVPALRRVVEGREDPAWGDDYPMRVARHILAKLGP